MLIPGLEPTTHSRGRGKNCQMLIVFLMKYSNKIILESRSHCQIKVTRIFAQWLLGMPTARSNDFIYFWISNENIFFDK